MFYMSLTHQTPELSSYRNQLINLHSKIKISLSRNGNQDESQRLFVPPNDNVIKTNFDFRFLLCLYHF